jgi:hypothetical protein
MGEQKLFLHDDKGQQIAVILPITEYRRLERLALHELDGWLQLSDFSFWDNEKDAAYDAL